MDAKELKEIAKKSLENDQRPKWLKDLIRRPGSFRYYKLLFYLARKTRPELVVELGTNQGVSAFHFKLGHPKAKVITIDIKQSPAVRKRLEKHGIIGIESDSVKAVGKVPDGIDILFIDANHKYESVKPELEAYLPKMKKGGLILFDDIAFDEWAEARCPDLANSGMDKFWTELEGEKIELKELHPTTGFGALMVN